MQVIWKPIKGDAIIRKEVWKWQRLKLWWCHDGQMVFFFPFTPFSFGLDRGHSMCFHMSFCCVKNKQTNKHMCPEQNLQQSLSTIICVTGPAHYGTYFRSIGCLSSITEFWSWWRHWNDSRFDRSWKSIWTRYIHVDMGRRIGRRERTWHWFVGTAGNHGRNENTSVLALTMEPS